MNFIIINIHHYSYSTRKPHPTIHISWFIVLYIPILRMFTLKYLSEKEINIIMDTKNNPAAHLMKIYY